MIPLVVDDKLDNVEKTKDAVAFLKKIGVYADVARVINSKTQRAGKQKMRGKHYKLRKGPLFVYNSESKKLAQAVRNLPGVEICNVNRLNLRQLAPGGQIGRLIIWTQSAFKALDQVFGTHRVAAKGKTGYHLQRPLLTNPDIAKIINSNEVQSVVRAQKRHSDLHTVGKKNPLTNHAARERLNPHSATLRAQEKKTHQENQKKRQEALKARRGISAGLTKDQKTERKARKLASKKWINNVHQSINDAYEVEEQAVADEE